MSGKFLAVAMLSLAFSASAGAQAPQVEKNVSRHTQTVGYLLDCLQLHPFASVNPRQRLSINAGRNRCIHLRHTFLFQKAEKRAGMGTKLFLCQ